MVQLGARYVDKITRFSGVATGRAEYISGCTQVLLAPGVDKDGNWKDSNWFDEQRLQVVPGSDVITLDNGDTPGFDKAAPKR
jgi:hypothetical protein